MLYWVIYDISVTPTRSKVASCCKNYGLVRVQKSAFLGQVSTNRVEMLALDIRGALGGNNKDAVFIIPACKQCYKAKIIIGSLDEEKVREKDYYLVG